MKVRPYSKSSSGPWFGASNTPADTTLAKGRVVAEGTADELKAKIGGDRIEVVLHDASELAATAELVGLVVGGVAEIDADMRRVSAPVAARVMALTDVVRAVRDRGIAVEDIGLRRPTLDEAFLHLTGHHVSDRPGSGSREEITA